MRRTIALGLLRRVAGLLGPVRGDDRVPPDVRRALAPRRLLRGHEPGRHVRLAVDLVVVEVVARPGRGRRRGSCRAWPASAAAGAAVVVGPDDLVEEALAAEELVEHDLDVVRLAVVEVDVERPVLGEQRGAPRSSRGTQEAEVVVEGVVVGERPATTPCGSAGPPKPARSPSASAHRAQALAPLRPPGVERRIDVDQVERAVGQAGQDAALSPSISRSSSSRTRSGRSAALARRQRSADAYVWRADAARRLALIVLAVARRPWRPSSCAVQRPPTTPAHAHARSRATRRPPATRSRGTPDRRAELERRAAAGLATSSTPRAPAARAVGRRARRRYRPVVERVATRDAPRLRRARGASSCSRAAAAGRDAPAANDLDGAVGLTQILAETGQNLLGMRVDVRRSERLTRAASRRGAEASRPALRAAPPGRRALRPRQGARGDRPLPADREGAPRPRRPRRRRATTWASATCRARSPPTATSGHPVRAALLRLHAAAARAGVAHARAARRRLLDLPLAGHGGRGDHAPVPRGPRRPRAPRRSSRAARPQPRRCCTRPTAPTPFRDPFAVGRARDGRPARRPRRPPPGPLRRADRPHDGRARRATAPVAAAVPRAAPPGAADPRGHRRGRRARSPTPARSS